jgi:hypothetical protein
MIETQIIQEYNNGLSLIKLSKKFNQPISHIRKILTNNDIIIRNSLQSSLISKNIYHTNEDYFDNIDTHEKSYWIGLLVTDGSINSKNNTINLALKFEDIDIVEKFSKIFNVKHNSYKYNGGEYCYCHFGNQKIKKALMNLGFTSNKTYDGYINVLEKIPKQFVNSLILGMFDGDGSLFTISTSTNKNYKLLSLCFCCKTKPEIQWIKNQLMTNLNINDVKINHHTNDIYRITWSGYQVKTILNFLYKDSPIYLKRKKDIFDNFNFEEKTKVYSKYNFKGIEPKNNRWKARITHSGKKYFLGYFKTAEAAANAYDLAVIYLKLSEKKLNFPISHYNFCETEWEEINKYFENKFRNDDIVSSI